MNTQLQRAAPRAVFFVDGSNLVHSCQRAFNEYKLDVAKLVRSVCKARDWDLAEVRFYSGSPSKTIDPKGHARWTGQAESLRKAGITVVSRDLVYRDKSVFGPNGEKRVIKQASEKGIDVRIALDAVRAAYEQTADIYVFASQDQDLSEACREINRICQTQKRPSLIYSVFPSSEQAENKAGLRGTEFIKIDRNLYEECSRSTELETVPTDGTRMSPTVDLHPGDALNASPRRNEAAAERKSRPASESELESRASVAKHFIDSTAGHRRASTRPGH